MPYLNPKSVEGTAVSVLRYHIAENDTVLDAGDLVIEILTNSEAYYASNPKEIREHIYAEYEDILREAKEDE